MTGKRTERVVSFAYRFRTRKTDTSPVPVRAAEMRELYLVLALTAFQNVDSAKHDDGAPLVFTRFFARRHVQTITAHTCWSSGKSDSIIGQPPRDVIRHGRKPRDRDAIVFLFSVFGVRCGQEAFGEPVGRGHVRVVPSPVVVRAGNVAAAGHVVQTRVFNRSVV